MASGHQFAIPTEAWLWNDSTDPFDTTKNASFTHDSSITYRIGSTQPVTYTPPKSGAPESRIAINLSTNTLTVPIDTISRAITSSRKPKDDTGLKLAAPSAIAGTFKEPTGLQSIQRGVFGGARAVGRLLFGGSVPAPHTSPALIEFQAALQEPIVSVNVLTQEQKKLLRLPTSYLFSPEETPWPGFAISLYIVHYIANTARYDAIPRVETTGKDKEIVRTVKVPLLLDFVVTSTDPSDQLTPLSTVCAVKKWPLIAGFRSFLSDMIFNLAKGGRRVDNRFAGITASNREHKYKMFKAWKQSIDDAVDANPRILLEDPMVHIDATIRTSKPVLSLKRVAVPGPFRSVDDRRIRMMQAALARKNAGGEAGKAT